MSTIRPRILPAFTLLSALLVAPAVIHARPSRPSHEGRPAVAESSPGFLSGAWQLLTRLWGESGVTIDPDGRSQPPSGGSIDPNGSATTSHSGDSGVTIDPNG